MKFKVFEKEIDVRPITEQEKNEIEKNARVLIGIPHSTEKIDMEFRIAIDRMKSYIGGEWLFSTQTDSYLNVQNGWCIHYEREFPYEIARNNIVINATRNNFTHVLMLDSDMWFPCDVAHRLLNRKQDIVSALYWGRHVHPDKKYHPNVFTFNEKGIFQYLDLEILQGIVTNNNFMVGCGCLLISCEVFKKIEFPYFHWVVNYDPVEKIMKDNIGEDIYFSKKVTEAGYQIAVDTDTIALHHGTAWIPYELSYYPSFQIKQVEKKEN